MRKVFTILYSIVCAVLLVSCGADQAMKKGDKFYAIGEYFDAATQYKKAYTQTPAKERATRGKRALKLADCYRRINNTSKAIAAYNNAIRYKQADSLTHFRLAQQQMKNEMALLFLFAHLAATPVLKLISPCWDMLYVLSSATIRWS